MSEDNIKLTKDDALEIQRVGLEDEPWIDDNHGRYCLGHVYWHPERKIAQKYLEAGTDYSPEEWVHVYVQLICHDDGHEIGPKYELDISLDDSSGPKLWSRDHE